MGCDTSRPYGLESINDLMSRKFEQIYPYVFALLFSVGFRYFHCSFPKGRDILSASITMGAIFTGFLATLKAIVVSLQGSKIEALRKTNFFGLLLNYLQQAVWMSLLYCGFALGGFFYEPEKPPAWFGVVWIFLSAATLLTFQRVSFSLVAIIRAM